MDIHPYIINEEANGPSPQRQADLPAHETRASSQNAPLATDVTVSSTVRRNVQEIDVPLEGCQTAMDTSTFTSLDQQLPNPHVLSHPVHRLEQSFIGNPQSVQHDFGRMDPRMPSGGFQHLEPVAEEYQMQEQSGAGLNSYISATQQTMAGEVGNVSSGGGSTMEVEMVVDGTYSSWWDQPFFETFDADSNDDANNHHQRPEGSGGVYSFEGFSFG